MDSVDLFSRLSDFKTNIEEKLDIFKKLDEELLSSAGKEQWLIDYICNCLEGLSNTDAHLTENAKYINELLVIFNKKLKSVVVSGNKYFLKGNFYEILAKYFKHKIISSQHVYTAWYYIFQVKNWVKIVMTKSNVIGEILHNMCKHFWQIQHGNTAEVSETDQCYDKMIIELLMTVLCLFTRQIKTQYNTKKVFQNFCQKLLCGILCTRTHFKKMQQSLDCLHEMDSEIFHHMKNLYDNVIKTIEEILHVVICQKDVIPSLKSLLAPEREEPAPKRPKTTPLYQLFFDAISLKDEERKRKPTTSGAVLYKVIITGSRSLKNDHALTNYEEFQLLVKLCETLQLTIGKSIVSIDVIETYISWFRMVCAYDIYQPARDSNNVFFEWMSELVKNLLLTFSEYDSIGKKKILELLGIILNVNHSVLETYLPEVLRICLDNPSKEQDATLLLAQEELLCCTLDTYSKLHKLGYLMQNIALNIKQNVYIPRTFVEKYSKMISSLQTSQVLTFLKVYEQMIKEQSKDINISNVTIVQHITYLLCYLVLTNAALIPENFYMRSDLQDVIDVMRSLKTTMEKLEASILEKTDDEDVIVNFSCVVLLLQHGINQVVMFLNEFSLLEKEENDEKDKEKTELFTHFYRGKEDSVLIKYLQTCLAFDEMKYCCVQKEKVPNGGDDNTDTYKAYVLALLKEVSSHSTEVIEQDKMWDNQILSIDEDNIWAALSMLLMENLELFFVFENETDVLDAMAEISWALNLHYCSEDTELNFLTMSVYNNKPFQSNLVKHISKSIEQLFPNQWSNSVTSFNTQEENCEITKLKLKLKSKQLVKLTNIFEGLGRINSSYLSVGNMEAVFNILLNVFSGTRSQQNLVEFNGLCMRLLEKLLEDTLAASFKRNPAQCGVLFKNVAEYCKLCQEKDTFDDKMLSVFFPLTQVMCGYLKQGDDVINAIIKQIETLMSEEKYKSITIKMLNVCLEGVHDVLRIDYMITKGVANMILVLMESLLCVLLKELYTGECFDKHQCEAIVLYSNICMIMEKLLRGRKVTSKMDSLEQHMVECFKTISPALQTRLQNENKENDIEDLQIISFVMSQSELAKKMKEIVECDELHVLCTILSSAKDNTDKKRHEFIGIIKKVVLDLSEEKLGSFLGLLADKLDEVFQSKNSSYLLEVWEQVLKCKWSKEKRIILWTSLPKVIGTSVHLLCMQSRLDHSLTLLRIISSCMSITRHSFVVRYLSMVYHIYNDSLLQMLQYEQRTGLADIFEELYQVLSLLLFHHPAAVFSSIHSYINSLNSLFSALVNATKKQPEQISDESVERSYNRMSRLYCELGSHKENISKYSPYIIGGYIRVFSSAYIPGNYKTIMDTGIYEIFKTCTEYELTMMSTVFELAEREHFRMLRSSFEKYHKFQGKA